MRDASPQPVAPSHSRRGAAFSLVVPAVPIIGFALGISPLFLLGGLITPLAFSYAVVGLIQNRRDVRAANLWRISIVLNGFESLFFISLFANGLCP